MAGTLTIHSSGDGNILSGHSWIEYTPNGGTSKTYGTWGNNPNNLGNGLHEDLELGRSGDTQRSAQLTDEQEAQLMAKIQQYKDQGEDGWQYLSPCSSFAADAWETATNESLAHRSIIISNPSKLKESILAANARDAANKTKPSNKSSRPNSTSIKRPKSSIRGPNTRASATPNDPIQRCST